MGRNVVLTDNINVHFGSLASGCGGEGEEEAAQAMEA